MEGSFADAHCVEIRNANMADLGMDLTIAAISFLGTLGKKIQVQNIL